MFIKNWHKTDYAYGTIAGVIVPTIKRVHKGMTGRYTDDLFDTAISSTLADIAQDPVNGRLDSNAMGQAPCLPDDLNHVGKSMPTTLPYYSQELLSYNIGLTLGARSMTVLSTKKDLVKSVVQSTTTTSKVTKLPLLIVTLK